MQEKFWELVKLPDRYWHIPFFAGFASIISQIILIREFLFIFYGNELSIGIFLAVWLMWSGLGSYAVNFIKSDRFFSPFITRLLLMLLPITAFITLLLLKNSLYFLEVNSGQYPSIFDTAIFVLVAMLPIGLITGILFTSIIRFMKGKDNRRTSNSVYVFESIGSMAGGLLFILLLNKYVGSLFVLVLLLSLSVMIPVKKQRRKSLSLLTPLLVALLVFSPVEDIERLLTISQWKQINGELKFEKEIKTDYQTLSIMELAGERTLYSDGKPAYSIPDIYNSEKFVHTVFSQAKAVKDVLLIGSSASGLQAEILKYGSKIDCVEPDRALFEFTSYLLTESEKEAIKQGRINFINRDGREYVNSCTKSYDVILLNTGGPATMNKNRFYTLEFFEKIKKILNKDGIFAFSMQSAEDFLGDDLKNFNASVFNAFSHIFDKYVLVTGDKLILIGSTVELTGYNIESIMSGFTDRKISTEYFSPYMFPQIFREERAGNFLQTISVANDVKTNTDNNSAALFYHNALVGSFLGGIDIKHLSNIVSHTLLALVVILSAALIFFRIKKQAAFKKISLQLSAFLLGVVSITASLVVMFDFQTAFGSIYITAGIMFALNMSGLAFGAFFHSVINQKYYQSIGIGSVILLILFPAIIGLDGVVFSHVFSFLLMFVYSVIIGFAFACINESYIVNYSKPGVIYAFDLIGSSFGALFVSAYLIPLTSIIHASFVLYLLIPIIFFSAVRKHQD